MGRAYEARGELGSAIANCLRALQIEPANTLCRNEEAPRSDRFRILFNGASSSCSQPETTMKLDAKNLAPVGLAFRSGLGGSHQERQHLTTIVSGDRRHRLAGSHRRRAFA